VIHHPQTRQDKVRRLLNAYLELAGRTVGRWGVHPDSLTIAGLGFVLIAAIFIVRGQHVLAGLVLLAGLPLDALDGAVARATRRVTKFGGILDSVLDRFADGAIFMAFTFYFAERGESVWMFWSQVALIASFGVSYARARAGQAGIEVRVGIMDRMVRVALVLVGLFMTPLLTATIWLIAVGAVVTSLHRLLYTKAHSNE
jgi:phosphatidylglycerophosphate synthase